ncbi:hypothetical protein ACFVWY_04345 [Streptomyces sp. NPDC058195]|uniref:hypothetical protein n=1 Tax=Streptomyces sp. NPDC058195 TaxID=3346375 RepID=UPI0036E9EB37
MQVEIARDLRESVARLGAGAPYALKVLAGRLADDPGLGRPSGLPGVLSVTVDGEPFEDCPDLDVGYLREPGRIEIRFVTVARPPEPVAPRAPAANAGERPGDPVCDALTVREVAEAWRRVTARLRRHAPESLAAFRPGARPADIAALEECLGTPVPVGLSALWLLTAGDDGVDGRGCLPGNAALMTLEAVADVHRRMTRIQAREDARGPGGGDRTAVWRPGRIPMVARGPADTTSGLYLDTTTGFLGRWSRYAEAPDEEADTLVTYLEEVADTLESPALATRDTPGLIGGALVWRSALAPAEETRWHPLGVASAPPPYGLQTS